MAIKSGQYSSVDELPDLLQSKKTDYKSVDDLPDLKKNSTSVNSYTGGTVGNSNPQSNVSTKKTGSIDFEASSLEAGNDLSKSNVDDGKEILPAKNSLELVGEINDLSKVGTFHVSGGTGGAAAGFSQSPDAYKKSQENYIELKGSGLKDKDIAEIKNDLSDLSPEVQGLSVTDKDGKVSYPYSLKSLGELRDVDPIAYKTKLNAVKTYDVIRRTAGIEKANEFSRLQNQNQAQLNKYTDIEDFNRKKEKQKEIIRQTLKGDDRDIAMQRVDENSAIILNDAIPDSKSAEDYLNNRLYQSKGTLSKNLTLHNALTDNQDVEFTGNVNDFKLESIQSKLDPNNPADQIAFAKYKRGVNLNNALSHSGNLDEAALNFASSEDDHLAATIKTLNAGGQELPNSYKGEIVANFLNDPEIIAKAQDDPEFAKEYTKTAQNLYFNYPDFAKTEIGNIISQAREDEGYNNWFANVPTKGGTDKLVDKLVADGKMTELQKNIYLRDIAPELGVGKSILRGTGHILAPAFTDNSPIATPDLLTHAGEGWDNTMGGLYKSLKMATRIPTPTNLMPTTQSNGETAMDLLSALKNEKETTAVQPKGLLHKASAASGDFIPLVVSMAVGGGLLKSLDKTGEAINMALQFAGNNAEKALVAFPDSPLKQKMYTGAATSIDMFLGRLLPHNKALSQEVSNSIRKDITGVISDFASEKITADAAKKTILNRIEDLVTKKAPEILKANTETGAIMAAFSAGHNGLDIAFGAKPPQSVEDFAKETAQAFETGFLGNTLVAAAMAGKNTATVKDNLLKASANPEHYIEQIKIAAAKNPEIAKQQEELINNVNVAVEARKVADAKGMNEKQTEDFILLHVAQGIQENKAKNATVDVAKDEATAQAKDLKARKEKVYGGEVDTKLSEPIEGLDEQGIPIGDNVPPPVDLSKVADQIKEPAYVEVFKSGDKEMIDEALKEVSDQWHDKVSREHTESKFPKEIIDAAKEKYPQESNEGLADKLPVEHPIVSETEGKSDVVVDEGVVDKSALKDEESIRKGIVDLPDDKWDALKSVDGFSTLPEIIAERYFEKDSEGNSKYPELVKAVEQSLSTKPEIKNEPAPIIEKKNTGTEIEPNLGDGRKPVTLSGSTEAERQVSIEQRKKETKQTPMTEARDKLLERIQKYNNLTRPQKRQAYIEANKIKLAVDFFNKEHDQKHSLTTNRDGSLELRNNPTEKRASGKPIKNTLKGNENAIVDNGKPLMERGDNTKKVFNDLLDADVLPVSRRINGEKMSEAEHEATIQDIMDGIPSQRAENYLNSLEKQIKEDNFDFGNPDKNARTTLNDALNITVEKGEPMTPDSIEKWLSNESELTPEEQTTFDNIDNLITHYEQLHESENGTPAKVQQPAGKGQESNSGKANENGQPKSESSTANKKEPIKNEEAQDTNQTEGVSEPKKLVSEPAQEGAGGKKEGITHAAVEELRKIIGESEYEGKPVDTHEALIAEAQQVIKDNPNAANEVLYKIENGKKVTNKDNAILAIYKATIDAEMAKNPTPELLKRATRLAKTLDVAGTEAGKLLESRKLVGQEDNLTNFLLDKQTAQGTSLTEPQIKSEAAKYEELKAAKEALEKQLEAEREQHAKDIAELGLNQAKAKAKREAKKSDADYKAERKDAVEAAREALKKLREQGLKSTVPLVQELAAIAPHLKKVFNSLASQGIDKLDNVITQVHAEFKDVLEGLTKKNVLDIVSGQFDEKKKGETRNEKAANIRLLNREIQLLKELEQARKGEEKAKTEKDKVNSNRRIDELKEKIKEVRRINKNREVDTESPEDATAGEIEYNAKLQKQLTEKAQRLTKDIKEKKYLKEEAPPPVFRKNRKTQALEDKVIDLENKIRHERSLDEYNKRGKWRKAFDKVMEVLGVRRLVQSAVDISVPFRQGATMLSPRRIDVWAKGFQANLKSVFSPKRFERIQYEIRHDQQYNDMVKDGIKYNDLSSADPNLHNEDFRKSFVYKIPIIREPLKASNRSADAFLNTARYEMYKKMRANLEKKGYTREGDPKAFHDMANWVMNMTGSGRKHKVFDSHHMNSLLGNTFYGANLMASRFNLLNPVTYFDPRIPKEVRYEAMKDMVAFTGTMMTVATALAYTTGAKVSLNPDDSDFLQLRYDDKVYDISGGLANYVRTGLRIGKAAYTKATGTKHDAKKATDKAGLSGLRFLRNKLSPNTAYAVDLFFGKDYGQKLDASEIVQIYPMYTEDYIKAFKEEGGLLATATVLLPNILGIGYGSYASKGQIDKNLNDLMERNLRSDEMNSEKIYNFNDGGRPVTFKEFNEFADKRDFEIEKDIKLLYETGIGGTPYKELTQEQVAKEITFIKANATRQVKEDMFGKNKKTKAEKKDSKKLSKEHERYKNN